MIASDTLDPFDELVTKGWVRTADARTQPFGISSRTLRPTTLAALVETVSRANHSGYPFYFLGGGTSIAQTPAPFVRRLRGSQSLAVSLDSLDRLIEFRPMDFAVTVEAGMRVAKLREHLAMRGQTLMLDTPNAQHATIGGLLASGRTGPRRRTLGRTRDALLGAQIVLADGSLVECGGRVQRQHAGYDLARVLVGSRGTLGAYAAVHLRTVPLSEVRRCAIATLPEGTRSRVLASIGALPVEPTSALLIDGFIREIPGWEGPDGRIFVSFEGSEASITRATRDLRTALGAIGVSETRIFDRDAESLLDHLLDAPFQRHKAESSATLRLWGAPEEAVALRNTVHREMNEVGLQVETITDLHNGDLYARVKAIGPRALEIAAREIFVDVARNVARAELIDAPESFYDRFETALPRERASDDVLRTLRAQFDPRSLCCIDRSAFQQ